MAERLNHLAGEEGLSVQPEVGYKVINLEYHCDGNGRPHNFWAGFYIREEDPYPETTPCNNPKHESINPILVNNKPQLTPTAEGRRQRRFF